MSQVKAERLLEKGIAHFKKGLLLAARDCWESAAQNIEPQTSIGTSCRIHNALGTLLLEMRRPKEAMRHFLISDQLQHNAETTSHERVATRYNIALAHLRMGEVREALPIARQVATYNEFDSVNLPLLAAVQLVTALCLMNNEDWEQAAVWMQKALNSYRTLDDKLYEAISLHNLGIITMEMGDLSRSGFLLEAALDILGSVQEASLAAYARTELGRLRYRQGQFSSALHQGSAALRILWDNMGLMDRAEVGRLCRLFGSIFALTGDRAAALGYLQRATTYLAQSQLWLEWTHATHELDAIIKQRGTQQARVVVAQDDKEMLKYLTTLMGLMDTLESLYPELAHSTGLVVKYALLLGQEAGMDEKRLTCLSYAARLRDVGLTSESEAATKAEMQGGGHPVMSERILAMFGVPKETLLMVRHHHEKYSGSGFPDGLKGKSIPLGARVIFLAEHYVMGVERESANGPGYHERVMRNLQNVDGIDPYLLKSLDTLHNEI